MNEAAIENEAEKETSEGSRRSSRDVRIGVYVCHCGLNIAGSVDCEEVAKYAEDLDDVVLSKHRKLKMI
jgi:heterodisulfide reductase subunit A